MAQRPLDDVSEMATDALHVTVGLGMLAFQRLQVRRRELRARLSTHAEAVEAIEERIDAALDSVEVLLPPRARDASRQLRAVAKRARHTLIEPATDRRPN
jgi:hypothetical protein